MHTWKKIILAAVMALPVCAQATELPIMVTTLFNDELEGEIIEKMKQQPMLSQVATDNYGTPIRLLITNHSDVTAGGNVSGFMSAMLAGGSLGLLPMVTNADQVLVYEIRVNGATVARYNYTANFTEAKNIYSDPTKLDPRIKAFVLSTIDNFVADLNKDGALTPIQQDYQYYFGS